MSAPHHHGHSHDIAVGADDLPQYRRVLWLALIANAAMFAVEIIGGVQSGSTALLADAVDFAGDAANYGLSLAVLAMSLRHRAGAALIKAASMGLFGVAVLARAAYAAWSGLPPEPVAMGVIGALALAVNIGVALLLYRFRDGDANRRSVWLCTRNDALGNVAVLIAALGVLGTGTVWPDLAVAVTMAGLAIYSSILVIAHARREFAPQARS